MNQFARRYRQLNFLALTRLIAWAGTPAELARIAGVNRSAVSGWQSRGKVSREAAPIIAAFPGCPLTKEAIRPDIKVWEKKDEC